MKRIEVRYKKFDKEQVARFKMEKPTAKHVSLMIDEATCVYVGEKLVAVYKRVNFDTLELLKTCHQLKFDSYKRTNGMLTTTININSIPRNPLRDNFCKKAKLNDSAPEKHDVFLTYAKQIAKSYREYFSSAYAEQVKENFVGKRRIEIDYRVKATPFTSAVANKNCDMGYHFDNANTKEGISCMIILKGNVRGGELILPELDIGFSCQDDFILLFDGQRYLHGVSKIDKAFNGYRYTIVYYNNNGMHLCLPAEEENKHYEQWLDIREITK